MKLTKEQIDTIKDCVEKLLPSVKMFYPIVGGTAKAQAWNLKDPRYLDAFYKFIENAEIRPHSSN